MRNFILVCIVALLVAVGVAYAVGFVDFASERGLGKYVVTVTVNTAMLHHQHGSADTNANLSDNTHDDSVAEFKGKVTAVHPEKREIVMAAPVQDRAFELAKNANVTINGRNAKLEEVQPGDLATVTFEPDGRKLIASAVRCTRKGAID
jgi:hypothetical protein